jgi:predicted polyphosphate/ATP-dependent NAD kinase
LKTVGFIVNPAAGMGGAVGLKGTDGPEILERAIALGAVPKAMERAISVLRGLMDLDGVRWITCPGPMGEEAFLSLGMDFEVLDGDFAIPTTGRNTAFATEKMIEMNVDLLSFVGGDGTARDVASVIGDRIPVVGIPGGVKLHSAVFAKTPLKAGEILERYIRGRIDDFRLAEVMDIDEEAFRDGRLSASLYGYMRVPVSPEAMQSKKSGRHRESSSFRLKELACYVTSSMDEDVIYLLGSGSTVKGLSDYLGIDGTLLGVDAVIGGRMIGKDMTEEEIRKAIEATSLRVAMILSPIGGQGFLLGRGNQQLSPDIVRSVGREGISVIATPEKMEELFGKPLLVDTGDQELDEELRGFVSVIVGDSRELIWPLE